MLVVGENGTIGHAARVKKIHHQPSNRIKEIRERLNVSQSELGRRIGTSSQQIGRLEGSAGEARRLSHEWMTRIALALEVAPAELLSDAPSIRSVPLVGYVGAGELYYPEPESGAWVAFGEVEAPPGLEDRTVAAVKVRGDSMAPVYRNGDLIYFQRDGTPPADLVGHDCIAQVRNGPTYIKLLVRGSKHGRFGLRSYRDTPEIVDQDIEWAARVLWVKRA